MIFTDRAPDLLTSATRTKLLPVVEIFGPTIQGEGQLIGMPTMFIRFGGCDFRCSWCDSMHAVDKKVYGHTWSGMTPLGILDELVRLSPSPGLVTLSGGNPAIHDLGPLCSTLRAAGFKLAMETQGTTSSPWWEMLDYLTLSPKPPSSGMAEDFDPLSFENCLSWVDRSRVMIKIVVTDDVDYDWAKSIHDLYPAYPMTLQVCNMTPRYQYDQWSIEHLSHVEVLLKAWETIAARTIADQWHNVRVLPQLHTLVWGNKQGV